MFFTRLFERQGRLPLTTNKPTVLCQEAQWKLKSSTQIPKLEVLASEIFNGKSAVHAEGLLKEFCEKTSWFRGAVYPSFLASFEAQQIERKMFSDYNLEYVCRKNFLENLGLTDLELIVFAWLRHRDYDGRDEFQSEARRHKSTLDVVPAVISLMQHFGGDPFQLYQSLREKYRNLEFVRFPYEEKVRHKVIGGAL